MTDPASDNSNDLLAGVRAKAAAVSDLETRLTEAKNELREAIVNARRGGELTKDITEASGWSSQTINTVMREAGLPPDRSAPRRRK